MRHKSRTELLSNNGFHYTVITQRAFQLHQHHQPVLVILCHVHGYATLCNSVFGNSFFLMTTQIGDSL